MWLTYSKYYSVPFCGKGFPNLLGIVVWLKQNDYGSGTLMSHQQSNLLTNV